MDALIVIVIGFLVAVMALILPRLLRHRLRMIERRDLEIDLKERGRQTVLEELDARIHDKMAHIAKLEANAGAIYGAGGDEILEKEYRELRHLRDCRDIAAGHREEYR